MVVGNNPNEIIEKYSMEHKVEPYIKYKYLEAKKYQTTAIKIMSKMLDEHEKIGITPSTKEALEFRLKTLKSLSPFDYYRELTDGMYYDENGNALSEENPNGHYVTCKLARNFALPLKLKDGRETYSALNKDIDWDSMNGVDAEFYKAAWEVVMEGRQPNNENEEKIYNSMKDKTAYFSKFETKEKYATYCSSYWNYAFVNEDGWFDMDNTFNGDEMKWINNFYKTYVENLDPNALITIFECTINNG